jgi:hypothetical protein
LTLHDYCELYDACLYYRINYQGTVTGTPDYIYDYFSPVYITFLGPNDFDNPGSTDGRGRAVGNATGSYFIADCMKRFGYTCAPAQNSPPATANLLARRCGIADASSVVAAGK